MAVTAVIGTGATITHAGFTFGILEFSGPSISRKVIDANKMSTTLWFDKLFASLKDPGELKVKVEWTGALPTFATTPASTVITLSNSNTITGTAVITDFSGVVPLEDKMTADATFTFSGAIS